MIKLYTIGCSRCKVLERKLQSSGKEFETIDNPDEVYKFADEHDIHEAPFLVLDDGTILNFKDSLKYISNN